MGQPLVQTEMDLLEYSSVTCPFNSLWDVCPHLTEWTLYLKASLRLFGDPTSQSGMWSTS